MNVQRSLSTLNTTTEVPLSKAPNPQLLPGRRSTAPGVCSLLCVCTLDGLIAEHRFRVWVTILVRISRHFHSHGQKYRQKNSQKSNILLYNKNLKWGEI